MDITKPVITSVYPNSGYEGVGDLPVIVYSLVDPGNPPSGFDAATLNVRVRVGPSEEALGEPIDVFVNGVVQDNSWGKASHVHAGDINGVVVDSASADIELATLASLRVASSEAVPDSSLVRVSVSISDKDNNLAGSVNEYPFVYKTKPSPYWGSGLALSGKLPDLYTAFTAPIRGVDPYHIQHFESLRSAVIHSLLAIDGEDEANFTERAMYRALQVLTRFGREHFMAVWWGLEKSDYVGGQIHDALHMTDASERFVAIGGAAYLVSFKRELGRFLGARDSLDSHVIEEVDVACRVSSGAYSPLVEAICLTFYMCRLSLERPELFV